MLVLEPVNASMGLFMEEVDVAGKEARFDRDQAVQQFDASKSECETDVTAFIDGVVGVKEIEDDIRCLPRFRTGRDGWVVGV